LPPEGYTGMKIQASEPNAHTSRGPAQRAGLRRPPPDLLRFPSPIFAGEKKNFSDTAVLFPLPPSFRPDGRRGHRSSLAVHGPGPGLPPGPRRISRPLRQAPSPSRPCRPPITSRALAPYFRPATPFTPPLTSACTYSSGHSDSEIGWRPKRPAWRPGRPGAPAQAEAAVLWAFTEAQNRPRVVSAWARIPENSDPEGAPLSPLNATPEALRQEVELARCGERRCRSGTACATKRLTPRPYAEGEAGHGAGTSPLEGSGLGLFCAVEGVRPIFDYPDA